MIKNNKFYVEPQRETANFKQLFARLAAAGAGRPVDDKGFPDGPWTPEKLAEAISSIDANPKGIEVRAVQMWFQDNDNGISNENIRWLARIFGCHDPEAASQWQAELTAAKERLACERRAKNKELVVDDLPSSEPYTVEDPTAQDAEHEIRGINLALRSEAMFSGPNLLNLPIFIWGGLGVLWFLAFILGVHSITYSPLDGVEKQVGLIWSIGWNVGDAILLPIFLIVVTALLNSWKQTERTRLLETTNVTNVRSWRSKVTSFRMSFWAILLICFLLIFLVQWAGVYLLPLLKNDPGVPMIDWMLIALVEPETLSSHAAIFVSFLSFLYAGLIYWFLFIGLLLLFMISADFAEICSSIDEPERDPILHLILASGSKIIQSVYRCTVLGILVALTIKLNGAYLVTDAESLSGWLIHDAALFFEFRDDEWMWITGSPSSFFTSFLLLFLLCFVFVACMLPVNLALNKALHGAASVPRKPALWFRMGLVLTILAAGYLLVGQVTGFSVILCICLVVSLASLSWKIELINQ